MRICDPVIPKKENPRYGHRASMPGLVVTVLALTLLAAAAQHPEFISEHPERILSSQQDWGTLGLDMAAHADGVQGQPLRIGDKAYARGLGHHANGSITVLLDGQFTALDAEVGLQPCAGGSVVFEVMVDGRQVFKTGSLRNGDAPQPVHVDLSGGQEMRLGAHDAGDGITCDMANWAEARLTPAPGGPRPSDGVVAVDMAPFARVVTWDPARTNGATATRVQEFNAGDVFAETELKPERDNSYRVPVSADGLGCIGLQWLNRRALREIDLEFLGSGASPSIQAVRVEGWFGESAWQGGWRELAGEFSPEGRRIAFRLSSRAGVVQTQKVRWILPAPARGTKVRLAAFTRSSWAVTNVFAQLDRPASGARAHVSVWNGEPVSGLGSSWSLSHPLRFAVRYSRPGSLNSDPTILQFHLPAGDVSVAVSDLLENDCVYLPDFGLFVAREPLPVRLADYKRRIAGWKSILDEVRAMPDQTREQAMARTHHDAQHEGPVMLSLACDNTKFIVERDGTVRFHPGPFQWLGLDQQVDWSPWYAKAGEVRPQFGKGKAEGRTRELEGGWLPIPVMSATEDGIRYTERAFVAPCDTETASTNPRRRKSVCVVEFTAVNTRSNPAPASLGLSFLANAKESRLAELAAGAQTVLVSDRNEPIALIDASRASGATPTVSAGKWTWTGVIAPGEKLRVAVYLPGAGVAPEAVPTLGGASGLRTAVEDYWRGLMAGGMQVQTPDVFLNDIILSSQVRCLIDARSEAEGARFGASIAAMSYGPLESEAHSVIRGMDFMGHPEFARRSLDFFIHRYNTNGFLTTGYTTFGTAWHLWTLGEHYQLTRDTNWLRQVAPEIARVCRWIVRQTDKTKRSDPWGRPVPEFGLMPPGVLADWNSFAYHFAMNAYYVAALREMGAALGDIGHPDAKFFAGQAEALRKNTLRAYGWTQARAPALPLRDGTWIPHYPSQVHSPGKLAGFFPGQDAGRSWCYDVEIGAHQLIPTGVIQPRSREAERIMEHMEDAQFLADGWFDYPASSNRADWFNLGGFSKVQPYYTRNCEVYALRDDVKPFVRSYFNSIASLLNPEVMTFWEHFRHSGAWDKTHETGYFLHQTRTMLVQERAENLWLAPLITSNWLKDGQLVVVRNAPTRFGSVSFEIASHIGSGWMEARIETPTRQRPGNIVLRLRHPEGKTIRSVALNGKRLRSFDPALSCITLPSGLPVLSVRADF